jgi:hypothetical protein
MARVPRADIEGLVAELDAKVQAHKLSWRTAMNVWAVISRMFRDACRSKLSELRVCDDSPADRLRKRPLALAAPFRTRRVLVPTRRRA